MLCIYVYINLDIYIIVALGNLGCLLDLNRTREMAFKPQEKDKRFNAHLELIQINHDKV